jgi:hypothetical protein
MKKSWMVKGRDARDREGQPREVDCENRKSHGKKKQRLR